MQKNINIFDVVILDTNNKATILEKNNNTYLVEIVNEKGKRINVQYINADQVKGIIYKHK